MSNKFNMYVCFWAKSQHNLRIVGEAEPYVPARINCSNENACPAEGGGFEVNTVYLQRGDKSKGTFRERKLSTEMVSRLSEQDDFMGAVEEALNDYWDDDGPSDREDD